LPIIEIPGVNPDLQTAEFERPAIYIVAVQFDELAPGEREFFGPQRTT
jgi:hypothetical protein